MVRIVPGAVLVSVLVSANYLAWAGLAYRLAVGFKAPAVIRLLARNTVLVYILHMPLFYAVGTETYARLSEWASASLLIVFCLFGVAALSEAFGGRGRLRRTRDWLAGCMGLHPMAA